MSDNTPLSNLVSVTDRTVNAGEIVDPDAQNTQEADVDARIAALNSAIRDEANNRAGTSAPADNAVEGQIWANTTTDPAEWYGDPDGSGADDRFLTHLGIASGNIWPSFHAHRNTATQDNITGTDKIEFTNESFDTNNDYDKDTNFRFTPTVAGKYQVSASIGWLNVSLNDLLTMSISKNGTPYASHAFAAPVTAGTSDSHIITTIVDMNGSTDYLEVFATNGARDTADINGTVDFTYFCASRIA